MPSSTLGHDVTLFASAEAQTPGRLAAVRDQAIRLDPAPLKSDLAAHLNQLAEVRRRAAEFDVIHFHTDMIQFPMFEDMPQKTVTTLHGRLDLKDLPAGLPPLAAFPLVSISDDQRRPLPLANWAATVHHGMSHRPLPASARSSEGYLAFLGRISPEKRPDRAIAIATAAGTPLKIAAKVDNADQRLFRGRRSSPCWPTRWSTSSARSATREKSAFLGGADGAALPHRLARALRPGDDRGHGLRHAGDRLGLRLGARGHRARRDRLHRALRGRGRRGGAPACRRWTAAPIRARFEERFSALAMARRYL